MEWNVYYHDINSGEIKPWNIFKHCRFKKDVDDLANQKGLTTDEFGKQLKSLLFYYFSFKSEYEIVISPWVGRGEPVKVDIYSQVMMNFDVFASYCWNETHEKNINGE